MTSLAERLAPHLAALVHPGDDNTPPFPLSLSVFQTATLPEGMRKEQAEEMGLPSPDLALHWLEAVIHLIETEGGVELVDRGEIADLRVAAKANEGKRNRTIELFCQCDVKLGRLMVQDFDSDHPRVNGPELIRALGSKSPDCIGGHKAAS